MRIELTYYLCLSCPSIIFWDGGIPRRHIIRAGNGARTRVGSLEGYCTTTVLCPQAFLWRREKAIVLPLNYARKLTPARWLWPNQEMYAAYDSWSGALTSLMPWLQSDAPFPV